MLLLRARSAARGLLDALYPPRCLACRGTGWDGPMPGLCARCAERLPLILAPCRRCGREAGTYAVTDPCPLCKSEERRYEGAVSPMRYRDVARELVLALKFSGRTAAAIPLGLLLADAVETAGRPGDLIVPVPLSRKRFRRRGHNQADEIARVVSAKTGIERAARALMRGLDSRPQSGRPKGARKRGPSAAFRAERGVVKGRCVILVDDVVTTGATADACAGALLRAGAVRVVLAAACRA